MSLKSKKTRVFKTKYSNTIQKTDVMRLLPSAILFWYHYLTFSISKPMKLCVAKLVYTNAYETK